MELLPDEGLPLEVILHGNSAIEEYWTSDMLGGLMFRPFLHWLDKNMVDLLQSPFSRSESPHPVDDSTNDDIVCAEPELCSTDTVEDAEVTAPLLKSKRGTEVRLLGVDIGQTLGTAYWSAVVIVLSCSRCKHHRQVELKEEK